jgi:hypothetical protein
VPAVGAIRKIETTAGTVAGNLAVGCDFVGSVAVVGGTVAVVTQIVV